MFKDLFKKKDKKVEETKVEPTFTPEEKEEPVYNVSIEEENNLVRIVIADNELDEKELQLIYDFGMRKLGFSEVEIAKQLGVFIHEEFSPRASALK